jgi:(1->4)-alpha-D-glucan 1-alpha-D-glucosylmutase
MPVAKEVARLGAINSLSQTLLKLTSPGVPDFYQGNEVWDYSLVDPDNRRPVDYNLRRKTLEELETVSPKDVVHTWPDGRIKMFLIQRVLKFRRKHNELFQRGEYLPLTPSGAFAQCCVSFARHLRGQWVVVIVPRLSSRVGFPPVAESWQDSTLEVPKALSLKRANDLFTCRPVPLKDRHVKLADALSILPFTVITNL